MSSFEIASRTGYADPDRRSTSAMNGRPIRSRTSPERVVQIRPPASFRKVRTEPGFTNSLAIVRSVSSSRPSPSYTRMNSPRRRAASARSSSTNSEELGGVYQDCCRNQFIGFHSEGRRPYFERSHAAHDVGTTSCRASRSGWDAGHHRLPPGPNLRGYTVERQGSLPRGGSPAHFLVGMGGSAIAGDVFAAWAADRSKVPIQVVRDYRLPSYARSEDLLVAVSYS